MKHEELMVKTLAELRKEIVELDRHIEQVREVNNILALCIQQGREAIARQDKALDKALGR